MLYISLQAKIFQNRKMAEVEILKVYSTLSLGSGFKFMLQYSLPSQGIFQFNLYT